MALEKGKKRKGQGAEMHSGRLEMRQQSDGFRVETEGSCAERELPSVQYEVNVEQ